MGFFDIPNIGGALSYAQDGWNLFKDITGLDYQRQQNVSEALMDKQLEMNKEMTDINYQNTLNYQDRSFDYNKQMLNSQMAFNSAMMDKSLEFNREMQDRQFAMNSILNDAGRQIAQQRAAGINPSGTSTGGGSVSAPSVNPVSASAPSVGTPSLPALGVQSGSLPSGHHYKSDALSNVEAGLRLDTKLEEIRRRKAEALKSEKEANKLEKEGKKTGYEADIAKVEAENRQRYLDMLINTTETRAEAEALQVQIDAGYKEAMIRIQDDLNKIKERGVIINEKKLFAEILDIFADISVKRAEADKLGVDYKLSRKDYDNYEKRLDAALKVQETQADVLSQEERIKQKEANWYEVKAILDGVIGVALARGLGSVLGRGVPVIRGFGN